jgi:DNA-binding MarR family transcriptional regulator
MQASVDAESASPDTTEAGSIEPDSTEPVSSAPDLSDVDSSPEAVAELLGDFLKQVMGTTRRDMFSAVEEAGLNFTQLKCLGLVCEADEPLSVGALSERLGLSLPGVSRAVDGLVQRGDVKRDEDPRDRRSKLLTSTPRGQRTWDHFSSLRFAGIKRYVAGLSEAERAALAAGLAPLAGRLSE